MHTALTIRKEKENYGVLKEMLEQFSPKTVEKAVGVPAAKLRELAIQFMKHSPGLAVAGGTVLKTTKQLGDRADLFK